MTSSLHAAMLYRALGFSILPTKGKIPDGNLLASTSGSRGWSRLRAQPAAEDEIAAWFECKPTAGIGVITGSASRIAVADIEQHALHDPRIEQLLATRTPTATTPNGGRHLYFRIHTPLPKRRTFWGDLQAEGAYVVAPSGTRDRTWQLGPGEVPFAPIAAVPDLLELLVAPKGKPPLREYSPQGNHSPDEHGQAELLNQLALWDSDPAYVEAMTRLLGIPGHIEQRFHCILPGHGPDNRPSANLWCAPETRHVLYRCWHEAKSYTLCQVYQAIVARRPLDDELLWTAAIHAIWKLRTLLDTGRVAPPALPALPAPYDLHPLVVEHVPSLVRFFQARALSTIGPDATLTPAFLGPWCGISNDAARDLRYHLRQAGLIEKTGAQEGLADLYRLVERSPLAESTTVTMLAIGDAK